MRLHALIFAASQGIATVAINYDPKVERAGYTIGRSNFELARRQQELDELSAKTRRPTRRRATFGRWKNGALAQRVMPN